MELLSVSAALTLLGQGDFFLIAAVVFWSVACSILVWYMSKPRSIFMVGCSCYKPPDERKCSVEVTEYFTRRTEKFTDDSFAFMKRILLKSGLGEETYGPPFPYREVDPVESLDAAMEETLEVMFGAVDRVFKETGLCADDVDILVTTCSMFCTVPSLASMLVNRYGFREDVKTASFAGMGCSSGVMAVQAAGDLLRSYIKSTYALVVITENITQNTYYGNNKSMLVTNCIFRVGGAAVVLSSRARDRSRAKLELVHAVRTHLGAEDESYHAAFQREDDDGNVGMALSKDLVRVAGEGLSAHIRELAPLVLPYSEQLKYVWSLLSVHFLKRETKPYVPDFTRAFEHFCIHTGGKAVIDAVGRSLRLSEDLEEPARMTLHRFGNTSSSLVFYELAYFEAKGRVKKGDRVWMIAFGTGFKCSSIVWRAVNDLSAEQSSNPWLDCVHRYPVKC